MSTVSVYLTSYNQKEYLKKAFDSLIKQSRMPDEIIIVDDCSSDGSAELITIFQKNYPDKVRFILNEKNNGIAKTRNIALNSISSEYFTFLDGDDLFHPDKLRIELDYLINNPDVEMCFSNYYYINSNDHIIRQWDFRPKNLDFFERTLTFNWPYKSPFRYPMIKQTSLSKIGKYDETLITFEDYDFNIRLTHFLRCSHIPFSASYYRVHTKGLSTINANLSYANIHKIFNNNKWILHEYASSIRKRIQKKYFVFINNLYCNKEYSDIKNKNTIKIRDVFKFFLLLTRYPLFVNLKRFLLIIKLMIFRPLKTIPKNSP